MILYDPQIRTGRETIDLSRVPVKVMNFPSYRNKEDHVDKLLQCSFASQDRFSCAVIRRFYILCYAGNLLHDGKLVSPKDNI